MNQRAHIESLHTLYVELTGQSIFLNPARERDWFEWPRFRNPAFTAQDLRDVIAHLRRGIREQRRNVGALKFRNLIGQPDYFEEDLAEAQALSRPKPAATRSVTTTSLSPAHPPTRSPAHADGKRVSGSASQRETTTRIIKDHGNEPAARAVGDILNESLRKLKQAAE